MTNIQIQIQKNSKEQWLHTYYVQKWVNNTSFTYLSSYVILRRIHTNLQASFKQVLIKQALSKLVLRLFLS